ncbi:MAG: flavin monoamine oxidase family protein [Actinomycetota bacterium]
MSNPDVVVVGAGYAGLAAALDLEDRGLSVLVLEGRRRVGGRAWTVRLEGGELAELGGEWIFPGYDELTALATRLGLALVPTGTDFGRREVRDLSVSVEDQDGLLSVAEDVLASMSPEEVAATTLGAFLDGLPGGPDAKAAIRARLQGTCALELERVSLGGARELLRPGAAGATLRFADGNQALAEAVAGRLADVRLGHVVGRVRQDPAGVRVGVRDGPMSVEIGAAAAVLAVPLPVLRSLALEPRPPADVQDALRALSFGVASKLAVPVEGDLEPAARQSAAGPFWWWTARGEGGGVRGCVTAFAGSLAAQEDLRVGDGAARWLDRIRSLDPAVRPAGAARVAVWGEDAFSGGAYTAVGPGDAARLEALSRPLGRVAIAGEHSAGSRWHGTLEGAIRSGRRAAREVGDLLSRG